MCGFVGQFDTQTERDKHRPRLKAALEILERRGPDGKGVFRRDRLLLGHTRLAIIDPTESAKQPMVDSSGRYVIVFNGEIYNFRELAAAYCKNDPALHQDSDTAVLLALYKRLGRRCVNVLNGMFAFAIVDLTEHVVFMARDRFGEKPLYWRLDQGQLVFASELQVMKVFKPTLSWRLDPESVGVFHMLGSIPAPKTIYRDVQALEAGTWMQVDALGRVLADRYWSVEHAVAAGQAPGERRSYMEAVEGTRVCLRDAVGSRMVSDVEVGLFLSGGIDSCGILDVLRASQRTAVQALCLDYPHREYSEYDGALVAANHFQCRLNRCELSVAGFLEGIQGYFASMDQPTSDGYNTYFVCRAAQEMGIKVWLSGVGGDELFGGYSFFQRVRWLRTLAQGLPWIVPQALATWMSSQLSVHPRLNRVMRLACHGDPLVRAYQTGRSILSSHSAWSLLAPSLRRDVDVMEHLVSRLFPATDLLSDDCQRATVLESAVYMRSQLLRDMDNFSMAHSIELRAPFLDHRLFEYVLNLPERFKMQADRVKPLLVDALPLPLPQAIRNAKKRGFTLPMKIWLNQQLAESFERYALDKDSEAFWDLSIVSDLWSGYREGRVGWGTVWSLYSFARWVKDHGESL